MTTNGGRVLVIGRQGAVQNPDFVAGIGQGVNAAIGNNASTGDDPANGAEVFITANSSGRVIRYLAKRSGGKLVADPGVPAQVVSTGNPHTASATQRSPTRPGRRGQQRACQSRGRLRPDLREGQHLRVLGDPQLPDRGGPGAGRCPPGDPGGLARLFRARSRPTSAASRATSARRGSATTSSPSRKRAPTSSVATQQHHFEEDAFAPSRPARTRPNPGSSTRRTTTTRRSTRARVRRHHGGLRKPHRARRPVLAVPDGLGLALARPDRQRQARQPGELAQRHELAAAGLAPFIKKNTKGSLSRDLDRAITAGTAATRRGRSRISPRWSRRSSRACRASRAARAASAATAQARSSRAPSRRASWCARREAGRRTTAAAS